MIQTIEELLAFTEALSQKKPFLKHLFLLARPGCAENRMQFLQQQLPHLPPEYLSVIQKIDFNNKFLGYFSLSPSFYPGKDLIEKLMEYHSPQNLFYESFQQYAVCQIGAWEHAPVAVVCQEGSYQREQIVLYKTHGGDDAPAVIARRFDHFLFLAGTLAKIKDKYEGLESSEGAVEEFRQGFHVLFPDASPETQECWRFIATRDLY